MFSHLMIKAARNSAEWCDAVCRSHGRPGEFHEDIWINRYQTPSFYPNVVTLGGLDASARQHEAIRRLLGDNILFDLAVKDSFNSLDLTTDGFRVLRTAHWIHWPRHLESPTATISGVHWRKIICPGELNAWERAWGENANFGKAAIFLPSLLKRQEHVIFGAFRERTIVAGCVASRAESVVGISNIFVPEESSEEFRVGCVAATLHWCAGLSLVGYESGSDLFAMKALGFESLGYLKIWVRSA